MKKRSLQEWRARPRSVVAIYPGMYTMAYLTTEAGLKEYGATVQAIIAVLTEKDFEFLIDSKEDCEHVGALLLKRFKQDPTYLDSLITWSEGRKSHLYEYLSDNLNEQNIEALSNDEIADRYAHYINLYSNYHLKQTPSWWIGTPAVEKELRRLLTEAGIADIDMIIPILIDPLQYQSENFEEELELLDIAIDTQEGKDTKASLNNHAKTYGSIPHSYKTNIVWDEAHFIKKLNAFLADNPKQLKASRLAEVQRKIEEQSKLVQKLQLSKDIIYLAECLRKLAYIQELKKTTQTRSHPLLTMVVHREIAKRLGIDKKYMEYLSVDEIVPALKAGALSQSFKDELVQRDIFSVIIIEQGKSSWLLGDEAREFVEVNEIMQELIESKSIKGTIASRGLAQGIVKVCESSAEISKVEEGDILVTAMTTPDFVPAMRRAAAVITNEGGITCHAAIVSRELGIPCIIGTRNATKILKDGDLVEVDAEKGIIKILK